MKAPSPEGPESFRHRAILPRFRDAFSGILQAYVEEPNLRFHIFAGVCVAVAAYAVKPEGWEIAYLSVTMTMVLLAEMTNTAVERTVDLATSGRRHPLAAMAKEVAAGAVLLTALHATFAALYLFVVRRGFMITLTAMLDLMGSAPWMLIFPIATGVMGLLGGRMAPPKRR